MNSSSETIATWISETDEGSIPVRIKRRARLAIADAIGVGLAASASSVGEPYRRYGSAIAGSGRATLLTGGRAEPAEAALVNGGLIHSLEYDDTHTGSIIHGSSVILPTALALSEDLGLSGAQLLRLYILGYEALIQIGLSAPGLLQRRGFQVTSVAGAMVAAAMAATANDLTRSQAAHAIGISLSQASGSMEFLSNGSSVKSLHPGWAAHAGIKAAQFAGAGMTGPLTAFEGRFGYFALFGVLDDGTAAGSLDEIGLRWRLDEVATKFNPCCHYIHPFIEAALMLRERGIDASSVAAVTFAVPQGAAGVICEPWETKLSPPSGHAMRWSLPLCFANALLDGSVDLATFERPPSEEALTLARSTRWKPLAESAFPRCFDAGVRCELSGGDIVELRVDDAYGNATRPPDEADIWRKFEANVSHAGRIADCRDLRSLLGAADDLESVEPLSRALRQVQSPQAARSTT
jgi:2-methylcitrate dehydratase PrpD